MRDAGGETAITGAGTTIQGKTRQQENAENQRNLLEHIYHEGRELDLQLRGLEERFKTHAFSFSKNMAAVRASIRGELTTE